MNKKETLVTYRKFLTELKNLRDESSKEEDSTSIQSLSKKQKPFVKSLGVNPNSGGLIYGENNTKSNSGYTSIIMLSIFTFVCQLLFMLIGLYILK